MSDIKELTEKIKNFRDARDWKQFHNPKDMALSLVLEAAEVLEHFQWKNQTEIEDHVHTKKDKVGEELADVLYWILLMGHDLDVDVAKALREKINKNETRYPLEKSKGKHTKYTDL